MFAGNHRMGSRTENGFTLIELLVVVAIISVITAIAAGALMRSRAAANEAGAVAAVRVTFSSQKGFASTCGNGAYAPGYLILGTGVGAGPAFISADLGSSASPIKSGFTFGLAPGAGSAAGPPDCLGRPTMTAFYVSAVPLSTWSGGRSFAINANGTIWQLTGPAAPTEPFGPPARTIQ